MSKFNPSAENIKNEMPEILEWIKDHGIHPLSRYSKYQGIIDDFFNQTRENLQTEEGLKKYQKLKESYREVAQLYILYNNFKNEESEGFKSRLKKINKGNEIAEKQSNHTTQTSRNYLFELLVASKFKEADYTIDFNQKTDVIASKKGNTFYIECKKITSQKNLIDNIKSARNQLRETTPEENKYNLIFIDISNCIIIPETLPKNQECISSFINNEIKKIAMSEENSIDYFLIKNTEILGIYLCSYTIAETYNINNEPEILTFPIIRGIASPQLSDEDFSILENLDLQKIF